MEKDLINKSNSNEEKINRLMKIIENMNLNGNGPNINISKKELIKLRNDYKEKKNNLCDEKNYKREKLKSINPEDKIEILKGSDIAKEIKFREIFLSSTNIFNMILNFEFYFYDCESIYDRGWGGGWRCFQSFIKTAKNYLEKLEEILESEKYKNLKNFDLDFENLFLTYGDRKNLDRIYTKWRLNYINNILKNSENEIKEGKFDNLINEKSLLEKNILSDFLKERIYVPFETQYGWSEPFILSLIAYDFNMEGKLYLLNGYMDNAFTPQEIFEKIITFEEFIELIFQNFALKRPLPIIIDDCTICVSILGIKTITDGNMQISYKFLIGDPHINRDSDPCCGIYIVEVNEKGKFLKEENNYSKMNGKRLRFDVMDFMVYIPCDFSAI